MTWQTKIETYCGYPQRCKHYQNDKERTDNAYGNQTAFFCRHFINYRILESECLGDNCPECEPVGIEEYHKGLRQ